MDIKDTYNKISAEMNKPKPGKREETAANYDKNSYWSTESAKKKTAELLSLVKNWHEFYLPPADECLRSRPNVSFPWARWYCGTKDTMDHFCQMRGNNGVPCLYRGNYYDTKLGDGDFLNCVESKEVAICQKKKLFSEKYYYPQKEWEAAVREISEDWERIRHEINEKIIGSKKFIMLDPRGAGSYFHLILFSDGNVYGKLDHYTYINDIRFSVPPFSRSEEKFWEGLVRQVASINMKT